MYPRKTWGYVYLANKAFIYEKESALKILLLNSEYPPVGGGAGNASANIAKQLVQQGHEVVLLTLRFNGFGYDERRQGLRILRVASIRKEMDRSNAFEQISFIFGGIWGGLRLLKDFHPDIIIAFFGVPSGPIAWILRLFYGIPYIVSMRGGDVPGFRPYDFGIYHKLIAPFLRIIWRQAGALVANSKGLQKLALAFSPQSEIKIIPNGVDLAVYTPVQRDWSAPKLLSVGRVVYQKGFDLGMHALAELRDLAWTWTIAGDGGARPELELMAKELGIAERIRFVGWQEKEQLRSLYQDANLFLFPSRHEGMPNAVLEAMASGLPVIATQIAGSEELVVHNETGLLVPADDVQMLTNALKTLVPDEAARERMGKASRLKVEKEYSWASVASQYIQLSKEILGRRN